MGGNLSGGREQGQDKGGATDGGACQEGVPEGEDQGIKKGQDRSPVQVLDGQACGEAKGKNAPKKTDAEDHAYIHDRTVDA